LGFLKAGLRLLTAEIGVLEGELSFDESQLQKDESQLLKAEIIEAKSRRDKLELLIRNLEKYELFKQSPEQQAEFLGLLETRLGHKPSHYNRPEGINFNEVKNALEADLDLMWSLVQMEKTGGEPDVIANEENAFIFADCSAETPKGRRNCAYTRRSQDFLEQNGVKCNGNAMDMAKEFGVDLMPLEVYDKMQKIGKFDCNTRSMLKLPDFMVGVETEDAKNGYMVDSSYTCPNFVRGTEQFCPHPDTGWRGILKVPKNPIILN